MLKYFVLPTSLIPGKPVYFKTHNTLHNFVVHVALEDFLTVEFSPTRRSFPR